MEGNGEEGRMHVSWCTHVGGGWKLRKKVVETAPVGHGFAHLPPTTDNNLLNILYI